MFDFYVFSLYTRVVLKAILLYRLGGNFFFFIIPNKRTLAFLAVFFCLWCYVYVTIEEVKLERLFFMEENQLLDKKIEVVHQAQFLMNENSKVTIKSPEETFIPMVIANIHKDKDLKTDKSLYDVITETLLEFVKKENRRPTLDNPIRVNFQIFDKNGIENYTIFGFFTYSVAEFLDIAFFNEEVFELEDDYKKEILYI